jgi:PAS domain S-box/PAS domain S-box
MNNQNDKHADHYQQLVEGMPIGFAHCKMIYKSGKPIDFIYLDVNKAYEELTGLRNVIGKKVMEILPEIWQSNSELFKIFGRVAISGTPEHFERYIERLKLWLNFSVHSPEKEHFVIMVENITERKQAEDALKESEERFSRLAQASFEGITIHDKGLILDTNQALADLFGYELSELIGVNVLNLAMPESRDKVRNNFLTGYEKPYEAMGRKKDGTAFVGELRGKSITYQGRMVRVTAIRDITEHKRAEEELQKAQKLDSLGVLAGGIAHDFNNLLTGIFGYVDLARTVSKDARVRDYLELTIASINRARALSMQLLTFAKGGSPLQKITPLIPFIQETVQFALSGSNISCKFLLAENLWQCNIDKDQIGQVIDNIVINAQQAMPNGGAIELMAENITLGEKGYSPLVKGNYVKISIKDYGIGIPKDIIPRIFDPFYTTKLKGHGLGLATCYSIINRHGGCIDVESEPGKGSTFHFFLPASTEAVVANEAMVGKHKGSGTIIVMDDEEAVRETVRLMLESLGYTVVCKNNGREAIDFYINETRSNRHIAAMIFDLTVPGGMGGLEAIKEIRELNKEVPVFVVSGYAENSVMKNPGEYGFTASISKPFTIAEFSEMLNKNLKN